MTPKVEYRRILLDFSLQGDVERVIFFKDSFKTDQLIRIARGQIYSQSSNEIEVEEGQGRAVHSSSRIQEIRSLSPNDRISRTRDLMDDFLTADVVTIEKPAEES